LRASPAIHNPKLSFHRDCAFFEARTNPVHVGIAEAIRSSGYQLLPDYRQTGKYPPQFGEAIFRSADQLGVAKK
jgi:hypothetical protein